MAQDAGRHVGECASCGCRGAWRNDVALEMWIDGTEPIIIQLRGTLDRTTLSNLVSAVQELVAEGGRRFELEAHSLRIADDVDDGDLEDFARLLSRSGAQVRWSGHR